MVGDRGRDAYQNKCKKKKPSSTEASSSREINLECPTAQ
jgi:hypothetical protein